MVQNVAIFSAKVGFSHFRALTRWHAGQALHLPLYSASTRDMNGFNARLSHVALYRQLHAFDTNELVNVWRFVIHFAEFTAVDRPFLQLRFQRNYHTQVWFCFSAVCDFCVLYMAALWYRSGHYCLVVSIFFFLLFFSPILSGRRLHVYHTSTHGVALVRI